MGSLAYSTSFSECATGSLENCREKARKERGKPREQDEEDDEDFCFLTLLQDTQCLPPFVLSPGEANVGPHIPARVAPTSLSPFLFFLCVFSIFLEGFLRRCPFPPSPSPVSPPPTSEDGGKKRRRLCGSLYLW